MTTRQDQQAQSRRALRERERAQAQTTLPNNDEEVPVETGFDQQIWNNQPTASPSEAAPPVTPTTDSPQEPLRRPRQSGSRRAATDTSATESPAYRLRDFSPETRGSSFSSTQSAQWTPPSPGSEDLSYQTSVDANRADSQGPSTPVSTPPVVVTRVETSEGTPATPPASVTPAAGPPAAAPPVVVPPVAQPEPVSFDGPVEHTLTRRELRELRNAAMKQDVEQEASIEDVPAEAVTDEVVPDEVASDEVVADQVARAAEPLVELVLPTATVSMAPSHTDEGATSVSPRQDGEVSAAMAEFDKMFQADESAPLLVEPTLTKPDASSDAAEPRAAEAPVPEVHWSEVPVSELPVSEPHGSVPPAPVFPTQEPPVATPPVSPAEPELPSMLPASESVPDESDESAEPLREVVVAPEVYSAPEGLPAAQLVPNEDSALAGRPHKRDISSSDAITTSALVLPNFPVTMPTAGPVSGTGETLMTGSINLPRSLGANGSHLSRYDRPDIDDIIDAADRNDVPPDSAPVRATRAVSTYTSSQGLINAKRPKGNNLPMVLSIAAGVMMVGVVVLVVVGMVFKIF